MANRLGPQGTISPNNSYSLIAIPVLLGATLNFLGEYPITTLVWSAVINGLVRVPLLCVLMLFAGNAKAMKQFPISRHLMVAGGLTTKGDASGDHHAGGSFFPMARVFNNAACQHVQECMTVLDMVLPHHLSDFPYMSRSRLVP